MRSRFLALPAVLLLSISGCTYTTRVTGTIVDEQGQPVQAEVILALDGGGKSPRIIADGAGHFSIQREEICLLQCFGPAPRLMVHKVGYQSHEAQLRRFAHVELAITLQPSNQPARQPGTVKSPAVLF